VAVHRGGAPRRRRVTRRFFVESALDDSGDVRIAGPLARRLATVLRLRAGDEVILFDGSGDDVRVRLDQVSQRAVEGRVVERVEAPPEPRVRVHLYQSISKGERFEWLVEKATELGVARIVPLIAGRSVVRTGGDASKRERWRRIAVEAAEQCGRGRAPAVEAPQRFDDAIPAAPGVLVLPYEEAADDAPSIGRALDAEIDALFALEETSIFIGPEGGFDPAEVAQAREAGAAIVTLGSRVLRSETAGLVALTLAMQALGELG